MSHLESGRVFFTASVGCCSVLESSDLTEVQIATEQYHVLGVQKN